MTLIGEIGRHRFSHHFCRLKWLTVCERYGWARILLACINYLCFFELFCHDFKLIKYLHIICFLEGVKFTVISLALPKNSRIRFKMKFTLEGPFTIHKTDVTKFKLFLFTSWTNNIFCDFLWHFNNTKTAGDHKQLFECQTFIIFAICEPRKAISNFTEERCILLPSYSVNVSQSIECKVKTDGYLLSLRILLFYNQLQIKF